MSYFSLTDVNFKYPALSWVRFFAVVFVILRHAQIQDAEFSGFDLPLFLNGWLGVDAFFVLSGFLISTNILAGNVTSSAKSIKSFYLRRMFRTFPAYFFVLIVICFFSYYGFGVDFDLVESVIMDNIFFMQDYNCLLYTSPSPRDGLLSRMPSSA